MSSAFEVCTAQHGSDLSVELLQCVSDAADAVSVRCCNLSVSSAESTVYAMHYRAEKTSAAASTHSSLSTLELSSSSCSSGLLCFALDPFVRKTWRMCFSGISSILLAEHLGSGKLGIELFISKPLRSTNIIISFHRSVGFAFAYGGQDASKGKTFIGTSDFFLSGETDMEFWWVTGVLFWL
jgi:hypothetical protein